MPRFEEASAVDALQRWRRSVVRVWVMTMFAALAVWAAAAVWPLPPAIEYVALGSLLALTCYAFWNMHRGRCPRCATRIRFEPRIGLPAQCCHCGLEFAPDIGAGRDEEKR